MSKKKASVKTKAVVYVARSREEADAAIAEIGRLQRERETLETAMNARLAAIRTEFEDQAKPAAEGIKTLATGVQTWAESNRVDLTKDGKTKTVALGNGEIKWRNRPPSVGLRGVDDVIEALKQLELARFVRTKEEVDKEAILKDTDAVKGVKGITINKDQEDFVIVPFATSLEEVAA